jgi:hypothetical protein
VGLSSEVGIQGIRSKPRWSFMVPHQTHPNEISYSNHYSSSLLYKLIHPQCHHPQPLSSETSSLLADRPLLLRATLLLNAPRMDHSPLTHHIIIKDTLLHLSIRHLLFIPIHPPLLPVQDTQPGLRSTPFSHPLTDQGTPIQFGPSRTHRPSLTLPQAINLLDTYLPS